MEANRKFRKKFVSSLVNVLLVLGIFIVLFQLSTPTAKAATYWYESWTIGSTESYEFKDDTLIFNGTLTIEGKLSLDNCTIQMRYKPPDDPDGNLIRVFGGGTFNVTNNSLITIYSSELTDRYEFKIYSGGKALIEDSTVEYMVSSPPEDGIEIYSSEVTIKNSLIQDGGGNGITISDSGVRPRISYSNIINNAGYGIHCKNSASPIIENCNISSNYADGIYTVGCSNMEIRNNTVSNNGITINRDGIYLHLPIIILLTIL